MTPTTLKALVDRLADKTLGFGCRIKVRWTDDSTPEELVFQDRYMHLNGEMQVMEDNISGDIVEILGHPVTLARVLLIAKKEKLRSFTFDDTIITIWDLEHDDLRHQSPECIDFLASIFLPLN